MENNEYISAAKFYNTELLKRDRLNSFFEARLPKNPIITSILMLIVLAVIESFFTTYGIVPVLLFVVCHELWYKGERGVRLMLTCMDYEMTLLPSSDEDRLEVFNTLIDAYESDSTLQIMNNVSIALKCITVFTVSFMVTSNVIQ